MKKQWSADITLTNKIVQSLISEQFPELKPIQVKQLDNGWDNSVFLVNQNYVFRFPRRRVAVKLIEMENGLLPWLSSQLPVSIPNPCFVGKPTNKYPFPFSGYLKINGTVPQRLKLKDDQRAISSIRLAEFLRSLHSIPTVPAIDHGISTSDTIGRMDIRKRIPMFVAKVEEAYNKGLIDEPNELLSEIDKLSMIEWNKRQNSTVVHGDLNFRNFLVDNDGSLTGVIDWGDAHIGHPAVDLSLVYSYLPSYSHEAFFKVYGKVAPETLLLAHFRALYANVLILLYAHDIGDSQQQLEAQRSIINTMSSPLINNEFI